MIAIPNTGRRTGPAWIRFFSGLVAGLLLSLAALAGSPDMAWFAGGHIGVSGLALSRDGATLASASIGDNTGKLWSLPAGGLQHTLAAHDGQVYSTDISADGKYVVTAGELVFGDSSLNIKLWDATDGGFIGDFSGSNGLVFSARFSPDSTLLATGEEGSVVNNLPRIRP